MVNFDFNSKCYGCSACYNVCPKNAISMVRNEEGFLVPHIDKDKCNNCGACDKKCPYLNEKNTNEVSKQDKIKCSYRKNTDNYKSYTSSGLFSAIAIKIINDGGYVCGCIWDENMRAKHTITNDINTVRKMAGSKYVQSDITDVYKEIKERLKEKRKVLFCGTPCQIFAIKNFFNNDENLYTIGIVCHGTPSPAVWEKYKESLEKKENAKMIDANFRYKGKFGWITPFTKYDFDNGKSIINLSFTDDPYVIAFGEDILHRNTCYTCQFKGTNSNADLIVGDFWGCKNNILKASKNKGVSSIICHTEKGNELLNLIAEDFVFDDISLEEMVKENPSVINHVKYNKLRNEFYECFKNDKSIEKLSVGMNNKNYKIKHFLYKISIFEYLKRLKYYITHK